MEINQVVSIIKDIILSVTAISTAYIAIRGINKWQDELKGKVYFETARNLIKSVYKFRDEISYARNPFTFGSEYPDDYDHIVARDPKKEAKAVQYVYQNRLKPLIEAARDLDINILESEVLWGKNIKIECINLRKTFFKLENSIVTYIENIDSNYENLKHNEILLKEIKADIYEKLNRSDNLSKTIDESIEKIENIIRPYLDKKIK